jgi:uncharacterized protein
MNKRPSINPRRLDVEAFARSAATASGHRPLCELPRLASLLPSVTAADEVAWRLEGGVSAPIGGRCEPRLHLVATAVASLQCQRCLEPVKVRLAVDRMFRFLPDEAAAAALDTECDDEVLVTTHALDVVDLLEDELLLALPLVPRHDNCPVDLMARARGEPAAVQRPFESLAALKKR